MLIDETLTTINKGPLMRDALLPVAANLQTLRIASQTASTRFCEMVVQVTPSGSAKGSDT